MEINYLDWNNSIEILTKAYQAGLFALIIGPKGNWQNNPCKEVCLRVKKGVVLRKF